jgi:glycosyltransferase involved in cell wall biosynthesis
MRIAIISSGFLPVVDGVTVTLHQRLQKLSDRGHQVLLFCPDYSAIPAVYPDWKAYTGELLPGVRVVNLASEPFMDLDFERNVTQKSYQTLVQELKKFQPDIVHVDEPERLFMGFLKVPGVSFAKQARIPCVSFFHTNFIEYGKDYFSFPAIVDTALKFMVQSLFVWIYNSYDATLVASRVTQQKIAEMGIKNPILNSHLLGVELAKFDLKLRQAQFFEQKYQIPNVAHKVKLVFLGRLTPDKGWKFTIEALPAIAQMINLEQVAWMIAGDGPLREQISQEFSRFTSHVYFLGRIPPEEVPVLLINSDVHITASEKETRGLTVLEAFAAKIPVIAPRAGGLTDSIRDGWNGLLFNPQDHNDFVKQLKLLVEDETLRQSMGAKARETAAELSWDQAVEILLQLWQEQIDRKSRPRLAAADNN